MKFGDLDLTHKLDPLSTIPGLFEAIINEFDLIITLVDGYEPPSLNKNGKVWANMSVKKYDVAFECKIDNRCIRFGALTTKNKAGNYCLILQDINMHSEDASVKGKTYRIYNYRSKYGMTLEWNQLKVAHIVKVSRRKLKKRQLETNEDDIEYIGGVTDVSLPSHTKIKTEKI
jgi:hypothetical protein